jgi:hypothetical protein
VLPELPEDDEDSSNKQKSALISSSTKKERNSRKTISNLQDKKLNQFKPSAQEAAGSCRDDGDDALPDIIVDETENRDELAEIAADFSSCNVLGRGLFVTKSIKSAARVRYR